MKNNKLCKKLCDMVDLYQVSNYPINEIISAIKLNIQDIFEENLTKHNSSSKKDRLQEEMDKIKERGKQARKAYDNFRKAI